jgi:O-acetyl-ADP-ribose deacetylase (regulator of RNase III)
MRTIYHGHFNRLEFSLAQGDLFESGADAIVNSEQSDFILSKDPGTISGQIRSRLGRCIQDELDAYTGMDVLHAGTVLATSGGNAFRRIYHAGFHDPDDWPGHPGCSSEGEMLNTIGTCVDQVLQMALDEGIRSVAFPLLGCGLVGLDETLLICQFLDSLHKCSLRIRENQSLHVHLVIYGKDQTESVLRKMIDLLVASYSHMSFIEPWSTGVSILDNFHSSIGSRTIESWAKWQVCRYAELALEVMCFGLCRAVDPPMGPEKLFDEGLAASFGKVREHALQLANGSIVRREWGVSHFSATLRDPVCAKALEEVNSQRNNLAHGRASSPLGTIMESVNRGLRIDEWRHIADEEGPFLPSKWGPWLRGSTSPSEPEGIFERWQKNHIRYLVPDTGMVFKVQREGRP